MVTLAGGKCNVLTVGGRRGNVCFVLWMFAPPLFYFDCNREETKGCVCTACLRGKQPALKTDEEERKSISILSEGGSTYFWYHS